MTLLKTVAGRNNWIFLAKYRGQTINTDNIHQNMSSSSGSSWRRGINSLCVSSNDFSPGRKCLFNLFEQQHQLACLWMFNGACVSKDVKRYFSIHYMCTTTLLWSFPTRWGVYGHAPSNNQMKKKKKKKASRLESDNWNSNEHISTTNI